MREQSPTSRLRKAGFSDPLRASRLLAEPASAQLGGLDPEDFAPVADPDQCLLALISSPKPAPIRPVWNPA